MLATMFCWSKLGQGQIIGRRSLYILSCILNHNIQTKCLVAYVHVKSQSHIYMCIYIYIYIYMGPKPGHHFAFSYHLTVLSYQRPQYWPESYTCVSTGFNIFQLSLRTISLGQMTSYTMAWRVMAKSVGTSSVNMPSGPCYQQKST